MSSIANPNKGRGPTSLTGPPAPAFSLADSPDPIAVPRQVSLDSPPRLTAESSSDGDVGVTEPADQVVEIISVTLQQYFELMGIDAQTAQLESLRVAALTLNSFCPDKNPPSSDHLRRRAISIVLAEQDSQDGAQAGRPVSVPVAAHSPMAPAMSVEPLIKTPWKRFLQSAFGVRSWRKVR